MTACSYSDFLRVAYTSKGLSIELLTLAIKNIPCRIAFYVYLLVLELATLENNNAHTVAIAQQTIATHLKVNTRTIKRAIAFLTTEGYLIITRNHPKKGGYQLNQIQVRFPEYLAQILLNKMRLPTIDSKEHDDVQTNA
jgi:hypothetical protein